MAKPIQNFVVGIRHGGDTRRTTEVVIVGAKTAKDAIQYAKAEKGKHHHYSCHRTEYNPAAILREGMVSGRNRTSSPFIEINNEIYLETDESRKIHGFDKDGEPTLTIERKYVKRFARKATDCLWQPTSVIAGAKSIALHLKHDGPVKSKPVNLTYHPMRQRS